MNLNNCHCCHSKTVVIFVMIYYELIPQEAYDMKSQISWKVGGQQGEGIESTGEIFATAMNRKGYYLYGYRHFSSRIKGGHTNNKIRVSTAPVHAISDDLDILVAFDQETIELNHHEMREDSIIIAMQKLNRQNLNNVVLNLLNYLLLAAKRIRYCINEKYGSL